MEDSINQILHKFESTYKKIDLSLGRIKNFMRDLGNPEAHLPPTIHFAGTNGKGSTMAFLKAAIEAAGKTCHTYTSPHLVRFNERIVLSGKQISNADLLPLLQEIDECSKGHNLTYFELTTAAAFLAFSRTKADFVLLETGLGGRLDATNIMPNPIACVFTPISFDHTEYLGNTLPLIAAEKYAISKPTAKLISAPQVPEVVPIFKNTTFAPTNFDLPKLALAGEHQKTNAYTAICVARFLGLADAAIWQGLATATWPARMQKIGGNIWLDGAHNDGGAAALSASLSGNWVIVLGMIKTKDTTAFLRHFKGKVAAVYAIPIENDENSKTPAELAAAANALEINGISCNNYQDALSRISHEQPNAKILVCGSLYLAGKILEKLENDRT